MLDPNKLPHLQPQKPESKEDQPQEFLLSQIISAFSSKKGLTYLCCAFVLIYISLCVQGEHLLRQGVYRVFKELGQEGFGVSYNAPSSYLAYKSGLNLDDLVVTAPEKMGGWVLKTGRISISSTPFTPRTVIIKVNGTHSLTTKTIGDIRLIVGQGDFKLHLPSRKEQLTVSGDLKNIQSASPKSMAGFSVSDLSLTAALSQDSADKASVPFTFQADQIHLPAYMAQHLPPVLQTVRLNGTFSDITNDETKTFLANWMNNSGTAEIKQGEIDWHPFSASFNGTFGLNGSYELIGAGIAKMQGFFTNYFDQIIISSIAGYEYMVTILNLSLKKIYCWIT